MVRQIRRVEDKVRIEREDKLAMLQQMRELVHTGIH